MESPPEFLELEDVLLLHASSLERWGGTAGVRDAGALDSAVMAPRATFGGEFLYPDLFCMAAAYAFGIAEAQAFLDGNKRTGVLAAVVFLDVNGIRVRDRNDAVYRAMIGLSNRTMNKSQLATLLRELADT